MKYDSPLMKILETGANMLIVSFLWLIFSLPIVTIVPSCAALYHTTVKIIFGEGKGQGVFKDFFNTYKTNIVPGIKLSLICGVLVFFLAEGLWTGYQLYKVSILGIIYMGLGICFTITLVPAIINVPPVLSRFDAPVTSLLRIAVYLTIKKPLKALLSLVLMALILLLTYALPVSLFIVPALYADLHRSWLEKDLLTFIKDNNLEEIAETVEEETEEQPQEESAVDIARKLDENRKKGNK